MLYYKLSVLPPYVLLLQAFLWYPVVNQSMVDVYKDWLYDHLSERPTVLVTGSATVSVPTFPGWYTSIKDVCVNILNITMVYWPCGCRSNEWTWWKLHLACIMCMCKIHETFVLEPPHKCQGNVFGPISHCGLHMCIVHQCSLHVLQNLYEKPFW